MDRLMAFAVSAVFSVLPLFGGEQAWAAGSDNRPTQASLSYYAKSYAVVVGVGHYPSTRWSNLSYARKDAEGMAAILREQGFDVTTLYDQQATRQAIVSIFEDYLAPRLKKNDRVLVFFSGHGDTQTLGGRDYGYLVPYNAGDSYGSLISMETLRNLSQKMGAAKHHLFIIDACFGGLFAPTKARVAGIDRSHPRYVREITRRTARQFITAGGKGQQVLDGGPNGYSYFTGYLLEALGKGLGDLDGDGYITLSELAGYLVPKATNDYQTPGTGTLPGHGLGEFLFRSPAVPKTSSVKPPVPDSRNAALGLKGRNGTAQQETLFWQSIKDSSNPDDYRAYLKAFPNGLFAGLARNRLAEQPGVDSPPDSSDTLARVAPVEEQPKGATADPRFEDFFKENPNKVTQELSHFLGNRYTIIGASFEISQIWQHRTAKTQFPRDGKNGVWTWMNFDIRLGRDEIANREGYFLIEIRGDELVVHDVRDLNL